MKVKWYHSVRMKLIGFFILINMLFLLTIVTTFFLLRENKILENASKEVALSTSKIIRDISRMESIAEEKTMVLASVAGKLPEEPSVRQEIISAVLSSDSRDIGLVSGGIWLEENGSNDGNEILFFNRNPKNGFDLITDYQQKSSDDYKEMEFYRLGRILKDGETRWTKVYDDPVTHVRMITIVSPIYRNGKWIGVASIDLDLSAHSRSHIKDLSNSEHSYLMMVDGEERFIGKSALAQKRIQAEKLSDAKSSKSVKLIDLIEPILKRYQSETTPDRKRDIQSSVFLLKDDPLLDDDSVVAVYHFFHTGWNLIIGIPKERVLAQNDKTFFTVISIIVVLTLLAMLAGYLLLGRIFVKPIQSISKQLEEKFNEGEAHYDRLQCSDKGEIGSLVQNLNARTTALEKARKREAQETEKRIANEKMLVQQSKMAAMGEMMDAAAHQWKQPLNALTMYNELLRIDAEEGKVDQAYLEEFRQNMQVQIEHMITTLDAFRSFFRPNKQDQRFQLSDVIDSVLFLTRDELMKNAITVTIERNDPIEITGSENEFKHLILNIISNAKDAFNDHHIAQRKISIRLINDESGKRVEIEDNAGGIPKEIIDDIFKANVTTKAEGKGTGIGLYMSTTIAEKHHATLHVENRGEGACFTIRFDGD